MEAVLFDWRGTLVVDPPTEWWVERALSRLERDVSAAEIERLTRKLDDAYIDPEIQLGLLREDCDAQFHRDVNLRWFEIAGLDEELSVQLYELDFDPECHPFYPDVLEVLTTLHSAGISLAVVSDIHFDLRPEFSAAGFDEYIDAFVLSFEQGFQKPDARMFQLGLDHLGVAPSQALMVGDRSSRDGGAASVGIPTLILPTLQTLLNRGLRSVLDLCGLGICDLLRRSAVWSPGLTSTTSTTSHVALLLRDLPGIPVGSKNVIGELDQPDRNGDPGTPWRSASSTTWSVASSSSCTSITWTPSPRTRRSWFSTSSWPSCAARSLGPGSAGPTGRSCDPSQLVPRESWAAFLIAPETILRWHRTLVRRRWTYPHRRPGRPPLSEETVELILRLARENPRWGYLRIVGELKKLGVTVSKGSVANVMRRHRLPPAPRRIGPSWTEFLRVQAKGIVATDFFTVDLSAALRPLRDRARAARRAPPRRHRQPQRPLGHPGSPQLLCRPRARRPTSSVPPPRPRHQVHRHLRQGLRLDWRQHHLTPVRSPKANAFAERWVRTVREDCLDHLLVHSRHHLETILAEYVRHYNWARPHRGLDLTPPRPAAVAGAGGAGEMIRRRDLLGGLIHEYELAA